MVMIIPQNLPIHSVVNEISKIEKFKLRNTWGGVCRWKSTKVRVMIARLPVTRNMYVINKKGKITTRR